MPKILGETGIWLAMPVSEAGTFLVIAGFYLAARSKVNGLVRPNNG